MTPLEQKLLDLTLTVMSHRLETTLSEAAGKNLSAAAGEHPVRWRPGAMRTRWPDADGGGAAPKSVVRVIVS